MDDNNSLDKMIREVSQDEMPRSSAERRIIIDTVTGTVVESELHAYNARFFIVTNNSLEPNVAIFETEVLTLDVKNDRGFRIHVYCLVNCESGYEPQVALALSRDSTPAESLKNSINTWVNEYIAGGESEFINCYIFERKNLESFIKNMAFSEFGLTVQPTIYLNGDDLLETIKLWPMVFPVEVIGHSEKQKIRVRGELSVDKENKARTMFYGSNSVSLEDTVRSGIQEYFAQNVSLKQFCTDLHNDSFHQHITQWLDIKLEPLGRKVEYLMFDTVAQEKELAHYMAELQGLIHPFKVEILSPAAQDIEPIIFGGDFYITHIDTGESYKFAHREGNLEKVRECLERCLQTEVIKHINDVGSYKEDDSFKKIEAILIHLARQSVKAAFGVEINVINVRRYITPLEMKEREVNQKKREAALELQKESIEASRKTAQKLISDVTEMEAQRFRERLNRIHNLEQELLEDMALGLDEEVIRERIEIIERARELIVKSMDALSPFKESLLQRICQTME